MLQHYLKCFRAYTLVPVGFANPIAYERLALTCWELAFRRRQIPYCTDGLARFFEFDGPIGVVMKYGANDFQTLLHTFMRRPASAWAHLWV